MQERLLEGTDQVTRARLLAAAEPHTAAWIQALPVTNLGLQLDNDSVRVAVALRLGAAVCEPHPCQLCQRPVDRLGHHGLSCPKSAGRHARHGNLNDVLRRAFSAAGLESVLEPTGLDRGERRRPDGITLFPFSRGKNLVWDATCSDTFSATSVIQSALSPGSAARCAEERKRSRYATLCERYIFVPFAVETTGVLGPAAAGLVKELGRRLTSCTGDKRESAWLLQRVSVAVARGNAASVLGTARHAQPRTDLPGPRKTCQRVQPSRDPHDDPELARYLRPRVGAAAAPPLDTTSPELATQELADQLLEVCTRDPQPTPIPPLSSLASYAALLAEMREEDGEAP